MENFYSSPTVIANSLPWEVFTVVIRQKVRKYSSKYFTKNKTFPNRSSVTINKTGRFKLARRVPAPRQQRVTVQYFPQKAKGIFKEVKKYSSLPPAVISFTVYSTEAYDLGQTLAGEVIAGRSWSHVFLGNMGKPMRARGKWD